MKGGVIIAASSGWAYLAAATGIYVPSVLMGINFDPAIGGLMGGLLRWIIEKQDWRGGFMSIAAGVLMGAGLSGWSAPMELFIAPDAGVTPHTGRGLFWGVVGVYAFSSAARILRKWKPDGR